jgi:transcriptional regulator with XRE-family HTH domain
MTPNQFKTAIKRLGLTDRALAARLGITDRQVRNYKTGERAIPAFVSAALSVLERGPEWLIGTDPEGGREFITHTLFPRFVARIAIEKIDTADTVSGITFATTGGETLCEIIWQDAPPKDRAALTALMLQAATALEIYQQDSEEITAWD